MPPRRPPGNPKPWTAGEVPVYHITHVDNLDGHPVSPLSRQFASLDGLEAIDWAIMHKTFWADTDEDGDRKRRRQAEFLVHGSVPVSAIKLIGVMTKDIEKQTATALANLADPPPIVVRKGWYY